jgi:hypothetical protein
LLLLLRLLTCCLQDSRRVVDRLGFEQLAKLRIGKTLGRTSRLQEQQLTARVRNIFGTRQIAPQVLALDADKLWLVSRWDEKRVGGACELLLRISPFIRRRR